MKRLLLTICVLVFQACGAPEPAQVKVGGDTHIAGDDLLNRYTVMVRLLIEHRANVFPSYCSGTLLDSQHVLLAAHCVDGVWRAKVLLGHSRKIVLEDGTEFSAVAEGQSFAVSKQFMQRDPIGRIIWAKLTFKPLHAQVKDIAIIKLGTPLDLPYNIDYQIPDTSTVLTGKKVTIAGYGIGDIGQRPAEARKSTVTVARDYQVSDLLEFTNFFGRVNYGDSGGPVWWRDEEGKLNLVGVHSFMLFILKWYTYSIDVRHHRKWIDNAIHVLGEKDPVLATELNISKRYFLGYLEDLQTR